MPRRRLVRPRRELTLEESWELRIGPNSRGPHERHLGPCSEFTCGSSAFPDEATREAAYWANREALVVDCPGSRPRAWWWCEADNVCRHHPPCERPDRPFRTLDYPVQQAAWLARHGVLEPGERAFVLSWDDGSDGIHAEIARAVRDVLDEQRA